MIVGKKLDRRTFLRCAGTCLALPLLDAMVPALGKAAARKSPTRVAFCYVPNGVVMDAWRPRFGTERQFGSVALPPELPRVTKQLLPYRDDILMLDSLTCNGGRELNDGPGDHARAMTGFLTGIHLTGASRKEMRASTSVDQVIASRKGSATRFASLELTCDEGLAGADCDGGYGCLYTNNLSWRTPFTPAPAEVRPRAVFERLFGPGGPERDGSRQQAAASQMQGSVLDAVLSSAKRLMATLGPSDRLKMDEYLFAVRDIEKRIEKTENESAGKRLPRSALAVPGPDVPEQLRDHARVMADLIVAAFQTDSTRVVTWALGVEGSLRPYREIGISEPHHALSHHGNDPEKIEKLTRINELHMNQFAYLLEKLKSTTDGDGTLLDHAMIVYGSGLSDGNQHQHDHLPILVAGRGNGTLRPGRYLRFPNETPLSNLWVSVLHRMGLPEERVGDSSGALTGLG